VLLNFSLPLACYIILRKQEQRLFAAVKVSQAQPNLSLPLLNSNSSADADSGQLRPLVIMPLSLII
jgi:hypothetical protein